MKMQRATENMKKLLTSKDKKEMILEMASKNEIDQPLMHLLQQNIDAARDAEQVGTRCFVLIHLFVLCFSRALRPSSAAAHLLLSTAHNQK